MEPKSLLLLLRITRDDGPITILSGGPAGIVITREKHLLSNWQGGRSGLPHLLLTITWHPRFSCFAFAPNQRTSAQDKGVVFNCHFYSLVSKQLREEAKCWCMLPPTGAGHWPCPSTPTATHPKRLQRRTEFKRGPVRIRDSTWEW